MDALPRAVRVLLTNHVRKRRTYVNARPKRYRRGTLDICSRFSLDASCNMAGGESVRNSLVARNEVRKLKRARIRLGLGTSFTLRPRAWVGYHHEVDSKMKNV